MEKVKIKNLHRKPTSCKSSNPGHPDSDNPKFYYICADRFPLLTLVYNNYFALSSLEVKYSKYDGYVLGILADLANGAYNLPFLIYNCRLC